jgi:hypothetical protein
MNTITKSASTNVIVAVDLGKYKSVACVHDPATGELRFTTFETTRAELRKLVAKEQPAVAVIEACLLAGWVHDLCVELGVRCLVWRGSRPRRRRLATAVRTSCGAACLSWPSSNTAK